VEYFLKGTMEHIDPYENMHIFLEIQYDIILTPKIVYKNERQWLKVVMFLKLRSQD